MYKVVCIGAGKLAHHLMPELQHAGCTIIQVYNRTNEPAVSLAGRLRIPGHITDLYNLDGTADLYFLTLSDDAIPAVAEELKSMHTINGLVIHCSGVLGLDVLPFGRRGVFYPLQTFSGHHDIEWRQTPIILSSDRDDVMQQLQLLARKISSSVHEMNDHQKSIVHLAAVFANNFTNHMMALAEAICREHRIPFDILRPLIEMTVQKALQSGPLQSQTGPAIRGDESTIQLHLRLMQNHPEFAEVYKAITKSIGTM